MEIRIDFKMMKGEYEMAKLKLPEQLKSWKVISSLPDKNGYPTYKISRNEFDGTKTQALLTRVCFEGEDYSGDNANYLSEEAAFIKNVINLHGVSNYIDAIAENTPSKSKSALYLITEDLTPLSEKLKSSAMSDREIVDFGLKMSEILEKLESSNMFHGNIKPENIYITDDGNYKLGGFTEFESSTDDLSFTAPEIYDGGQPDYTTDIYSLGLVMYAMSNEGKLPFESNGLNRHEAIDKRFSGSAVSAPQNGSEKLKSVIVIACQPNSKNRWKNAGNIKNALSSIKAEFPTDNRPAANVIVPESTEFESNVFEEYSFDDFETTPAPKVETTKPAEEETAAAVATAIGTVAGTAAAAGIEAAESSEVSVQETDKSEAPQSTAPEEPQEEEINPTYREPEIDNRIFDDYKVQTKVFAINETNSQETKDYGDFFEDEPESAEALKTEKQSTKPEVDEEFDDEGTYENNAFYNPTDDEQEKEPEKRRKGLIIGIIIAIVILAALTGLGVYASQNNFFGLFDNKGSGNTNSGDNTATQAATQEQTTNPSQAATTAPASTAAATKPTNTEPAQNITGEVTPSNVIGFYYDYAQKVLEDEGFHVVIGEFNYSDYYDYGYVIGMSPDDSEPLEAGSTIVLEVSAGLNDSADDSDNENEDNNNDTENAFNEVNNTENTPDTSYSEYKGNTSYYSEAEVNAMSRQELNLALNEIYARRGRIFKDASLAAYFNSQSWYTPKYDEAAFAQNVVFNDYEAKNITLIRNKQIEKKYI